MPYHFALTLISTILFGTFTAVSLANDRTILPDKFVVSYWYGPPLKMTTREVYQQIKDANFNVVFPPGPPDTTIAPRDNHKILDLCRELDLQAVIFDARMPRSMKEDAAAARIDAIVKEYHD